MAVAVVVTIIIVVVIGLALLSSYNRFVRQRALIDNAWANVDTELKRRYDLIPNLVETVKGYAAHERETLEAVIEARSRAADSHGPPDEQAQDENMLVGALRHLMALSEAYPDLKANESFADLQRELVTTENRIQAARRFYNNNVRDYNIRCGTVPSNVIASMFGFETRQLFEIEPVERGVPTVELDSEVAEQTETGPA
jgi:LemA protein